MDATRQMEGFLAGLGDALADGDIDRACAMFGPECFWRDLVAFTWNIATLESADAIGAMLRENLPALSPVSFTADGAATEADGVVQGWFTFETAIARGRGHIRLKGDRCWTLLTAMMELKGHEEKRGHSREKGVQHGAFKGRDTWQDRRAREQAELGITRQPYCLIVGGGQGGIALGARLRRLEVPTLVIDRNARAGDAWRQRYKSLCLHDAVWYDHMPYMPFPDHWPIYTPKDQIGDWLEMYTRIMELNYWGSTECIGASYDEAAGEWEVRVLRDGVPLTLRPKQLVLATGMSGVPSLPDCPGRDSFAGSQHHSSAHRGGSGFEGKRCVIVGSNNSAHDIAADLWEHDAAEVTLIQRSSTLVARAETLLEISKGGVYSEAAAQAGLSTETADLTVASIPYRILPRFQIPVAEHIQQIDAAFYDRLRAVGFLLDFGDDGSGLGLKYLRRGSGYYIDVGASELVANGDVKLRSGVEIVEIKPDRVVLSDGSELLADVIVYATGYGSMNGWAAKLISPEVAARVGICWGLGSETRKDPGPWEGELRNMWKPTHQPGLWFHGGNLAQSRHYSRYLALQIKARMEGIATPVYAMGPVHHAH
jgi:putative flavoprotein involved in K+ transport